MLAVKHGDSQGHVDTTHCNRPLETPIVERVVDGVSPGIVSLNTSRGLVDPSCR